MSKRKTKTLIDDYVALIKERELLTKAVDELRPQVVALGDGEHRGYEHAVVVSHTTRASISVSVAKSLLTASQLEAATVVSDVTTIRVEA